MKIAVIIRQNNVNSYENLQFRHNACKLGISLEFFYENELSLFIQKNKKIVLYQNSEIDADVILPRCGSGTSSQLAIIIDTLKENGKLVINDGTCIRLMKDKFRTLNLLASNNIDIIGTLLINSNTSLEQVTKYFEFPIVKKMNSGSYGKGIYLIENEKQLLDFYDFAELTNYNNSFIFQKFIDHKFGEDIRVYMFKDKLIGAMKRSSDGVDFKANYTIHKNAKAHIVDDELLKICQKIMSVVECEIAGIDILETEFGYVICEVNSAPGFLGMEKTNPGLNVSKELLKEIKKIWKEKNE